MNDRLCRSMRVALVTGFLTSCTTAPTAPDLNFAETYVGKSGAATITLESLRPLPRTPASGWLNRADVEDAVARFGAKKRGTPKYEVSPVLVTFDTAEKDDHPAARYEWHEDGLVLCMLTVNFGAMRGSDRLVLVFDYKTCALMKRAH